MIRTVLVVLVLAFVVDYYVLDSQYRTEAAQFIQNVGRDINTETNRWLRGR
jgi:hypothetical protein